MLLYSPSIIASPGPPEGVSPIPQPTSITVRWSPPTEDGGRTDLYYYVEISNPEVLGSYTGGEYKSGSSRSHTFSDLKPCTQYCVRVTAHNGVSDQDPGSEESRRVEQCTETLEVRKYKKIITIMYSV